MDVDSEEPEKVGSRELKRPGRGGREEGGDVSAWARPTPTPTSPANDPDFDDTGGTMPLNNPSDGGFVRVPDYSHINLR